MVTARQRPSRFADVVTPGPTLRLRVCAALCVLALGNQIAQAKAGSARVCSRPSRRHGRLAGPADRRTDPVDQPDDRRAAGAGTCLRSHARRHAAAPAAGRCSAPRPTIRAIRRVCGNDEGGSRPRRARSGAVARLPHGCRPSRRASPDGGRPIVADISGEPYLGAASFQHVSACGGDRWDRHPADCRLGAVLR
jgi:hypothetical protein